jgi:hypothetical protein
LQLYELCRENQRPKLTITTLAPALALALAPLNVCTTQQRQVAGGDDGYESVEVKGFLNSIRNFVAHVIDTTYQVVDVSLVSSMLGGLAGAELAAFAAARGWKMEAGDKVFVAKQEEMVQSKNIIETIGFGALVPLMASANRPSR